MHSRVLFTFLQESTNADKNLIKRLLNAHTTDKAKKKKFILKKIVITKILMCGKQGFLSSIWYTAVKFIIS